MRNEHSEKYPIENQLKLSTVDFFVFSLLQSYFVNG